MTQIPNYEKISDRVFIVRTQAGFKRAIREYKSNYEEKHRSGYPISYPSVIRFVSEYSGYHCFNVVCTTLSEEIKRTELFLSKLKNHDRRYDSQMYLNLTED